MQFSVILGMLLTILNSRKVTRTQLAEKFELDKRTVSRYIEILATAGVPIESISGKSGGLRIPDDYRLDNSFFSKEELSRLSVCLNAMQSSFDDGLNSLLLDKFANMAKNKEDEKYLLKTDSLIIDIGTWTNPRQYRAKIEIINKAMHDELTLKLEYVDRNNLASVRKLDPYTLVLKEGAWYLYGWCLLRRDFRLLKLSRIRGLDITPNRYTRRAGDVYGKLNEDFEDKELVDLEIEFFSTAYPDIEEWLGRDAIIDRGQKYRAAATLYGGNVLINKLLSFGSAVKVLSPSALKEEIATECRRIADNYL
ncbi:MAG: YafY family transcriptional regulator [Firmicutes bacterium]|nr:YafY family transcriptional regulator [Bacillota bacterium]